MTHKFAGKLSRAIGIACGVIFQCDVEISRGCRVWIWMDADRCSCVHVGYCRQNLGRKPQSVSESFLSKISTDFRECLLFSLLIRRDEYWARLLCIMCFYTYRMWNAVFRKSMQEVQNDNVHCICTHIQTHVHVHTKCTLYRGIQYMYSS